MIELLIFLTLLAGALSAPVLWWKRRNTELARSQLDFELQALKTELNPRKEFFRVPLTDIRREIESLGITPHWTMAAEAREYRESQVIESALRADPKAQREWERHQLVLKPTAEEMAID